MSWRLWSVLHGIVESAEAQVGATEIERDHRIGRGELMRARSGDGSVVQAGSPRRRSRRGCCAGAARSGGAASACVGGPLLSSIARLEAHRVGPK